MHGVEKYKQVRLACLRHGMSQREAERQFGVDRKVVRKMLDHPEPPGYRRIKPVQRPKLDGFTQIINHILEADKTVPKKQRHSAKRIFERLRDEYGFTGNLKVQNTYLAQARDILLPKLMNGEIAV